MIFSKALHSITASIDIEVAPYFLPSELLQKTEKLILLELDAVYANFFLWPKAFVVKAFKARKRNFCKHFRAAVNYNLKLAPYFLPGVYVSSFMVICA